ncbi:MAG: hypothetical protein M1812_005183 [Candelaria pacifica]|nr:MAG: hypothetical protein M1812_005183 [Candelaria pacifica]
MSSFAILACNFGLGTHQWDVKLNPDFAPRFLLWSNIFQIMYTPSIIAVKWSILLLYIRIFPATARKFRICTYFLMAFVFAYSFAGFWILIFACKPMAKIWDITIKGGQCVNRNGLAISGSALNMFTDLCMIALPIPIVWHLQLPIGQRISVIVMFCIAGLSCVACVVRLVYTVGLLGNLDLTYGEFTSILWTVIELWTGLICGCLPALRPFLHYFPSLPSRLSLSSLIHSREKRSHQSGSNGSSAVNSKHLNNSNKNGISWFKGSKGSTNRSDLTSTTDGTYVELSEPNRTRTYVKGGGTDQSSTPTSSRERIYPGAAVPAEGGIARTVEVDVSKSQV